MRIQLVQMPSRETVSAGPSNPKMVEPITASVLGSISAKLGVECLPKILSYITPTCLTRYMWKQDKLKTTKVDREQLKTHPALTSVWSKLTEDNGTTPLVSGLILWGPVQSQTTHCLQLLRKKHVEEGGLAALVESEPHSETFEQRFLHTVGRASIQEFIRMLPDNKTTLLLWEDAGRGRQSVGPNDESITPGRDLVASLSEQSHIHGKPLRFILCANESTDVVQILSWSTLRCPIRMVTPINCCQWGEQAIREYLKVFNRSATLVDACLIGGCPTIETLEQAYEMQARWTIAISRLERVNSNVAGALHFDTVALGDQLVIPRCVRSCA